MLLGLALLLVTGCDFSAAGKTVVDSADTGAPDDDGGSGDDSAEPGEDTGPVDTGEPADPNETDDDGDGFSEADGDCDDADSSVSPDARDDCDASDSDCDGEVDEDARGDDEWEPNDDEAYTLGELSEGGFSLAGRLHNDDDADRFDFYVDDAWLTDLFPVTVTLSNIPDAGNYRLTLTRTATDGDLALEVVDQVFSSSESSLSITLEDSSGPDEGGTYEVQIDAIANADCASAYLLTVAGE